GRGRGGGRHDGRERCDGRGRQAASCGRTLAHRRRARAGAAMRPLRVAVAQGALLEDALAGLAAAGIDVASITSGERRLVVRAREVEIVRARPSDIATYVARGAADLGIVGTDVPAESGARALALVALRFGGCR